MKTIKYININKAFKRNSDKSPTHTLEIVYEDGTRQYIAGIWYSTSKERGSMKLSEGVSFNIPEDFKTYNAKEEKKERTAEEIQREDEKLEAKQIQKEKDQAELNSLYGESINPEDIPF